MAILRSLFKMLLDRERLSYTLPFWAREGIAITNRQQKLTIADFFMGGILKVKINCRNKYNKYLHFGALKGFLKEIRGEIIQMPLHYSSNSNASKISASPSKSLNPGLISSPPFKAIPFTSVFSSTSSMFVGFIPKPNSTTVFCANSLIS